MHDAQPLNRGIVMDVRVGESVEIAPTIDQQTIVVTVEAKHGQRSRLRVRSNQAVRVVRQEKLEPA